MRFTDAGLDLVWKLESLHDHMSVRFTCTKLMIWLPVFKPRLLAFTKHTSGVAEREESFALVKENYSLTLLSVSLSDHENLNQWVKTPRWPSASSSSLLSSSVHDLDDDHSGT